MEPRPDCWNRARNRMRMGQEMNFRKRLAELERKFASDPIELIMPDGRTEVLRGYTGDRLLNLFGRAMCEMNARVDLSPDASLIKKSVAGTESGGCMIELIRSLLSSPVSD